MVTPSLANAEIRKIVNPDGTVSVIMTDLDYLDLINTVRETEAEKEHWKNSYSVLKTVSEQAIEALKAENSAVKSERDGYKRLAELLNVELKMEREERKKAESKNLILTGLALVAIGYGLAN